MQVTDQRFSARIALGVRDTPRTDYTTWDVVVYTNGHGVIATGEGGALASDASPEDAFRVILSLAADEGTWRAAHSGGRQVLVALFGDKEFDVKAEGQAAFFVRHLESILEATLAYADEVGP